MRPKETLKGLPYLRVIGLMGLLLLLPLWVGFAIHRVALCLMIAITSFPERTVDVAVLAFLALAIPLNLLLAIYRTIKSRRQGALMP